LAIELIIDILNGLIVSAHHTVSGYCCKPVTLFLQLEIKVEFGFFMDIPVKSAICSGSKQIGDSEHYLYRFQRQKR
jgi:hypothetical protein